MNTLARLRHLDIALVCSRSVSNYISPLRNIYRALDSCHQNYIIHSVCPVVPAALFCSRVQEWAKHEDIRYIQPSMDIEDMDAVIFYHSFTYQNRSLQEKVVYDSAKHRNIPILCLGDFDALDSKNGVIQGLDNRISIR